MASLSAIICIVTHLKLPGGVRVLLVSKMANCASKSLFLSATTKNFVPLLFKTTSYCAEMNTTTPEPLVSIVIISHNHESFIAKAIEGVLFQECDFSFELIICDDASTDNTRPLIETFEKAHPNIIKTYFAPENAGPMATAAKAFGMLKGRYLAWLDGDDYWTHPQKLAAQVAFLEANPTYAGCFHDAEIVSVINKESTGDDVLYHSQWRYYSQFNRYGADFFPWNLLDRNIIPTAALLCRTMCLPASVFEQYAGVNLSVNWLLQLMIIREGKFRYFSHVWSVYNDHPNGYSKRMSKETFKITNIYLLKSLLSDGYYAYIRKDVYKALAAEYYQLLDLNKGHIKKLVKLIAPYYLYEFKKLVAESFYLFRKPKAD